jgi:pantoate--beta-alanine ligase
MEWRLRGDRVAVVPTMGNLHDGHMSLVRRALQVAERTVVTIFVNPTQFGEDEDFDTYPRTLQQDCERLGDAGVHLVFTPDVESMYPFGLADATRVIVPRLTRHFCGANRPGHFDGVTTVVMRLFALVQPDIAVFGQKDYQQQLVVRHMVQDIGLPIEIVTVPTVREPDGLAMSSRNAYLNEKERSVAAAIYAELQDAGEQLRQGNVAISTLEADANLRLRRAGLEPEYFAIRRASDLSPVIDNAGDYVLLAAARLGAVRLIDNILVSRR